jgi:HPt (histidine-containing phosphotransfer) domain-containing protein
LEELSSAIGPEKLQQSLSKFFAELDQLLEKLTGPADRPGRPDDIALAAEIHRTKGAAALFGFRDLEDCLMELDAAATEGALGSRPEAVRALQQAASAARGRIAAE